MTEADALALIAKISTDLDALIAKQGGAIPQSVSDALNALDAKITAATVPPAV